MLKVSDEKPSSQAHGEFCLACLYNPTHRSENTLTHTSNIHVYLLRVLLHAPKLLLYFPHLYITLFFHLFPLHPPFPTDLQDPSWSRISQTPHQHLIFQTCGSTGFSRLASPSGNPALGSAQPAPSTDPVCTATAPSSPSPPEAVSRLMPFQLQIICCLLGFLSSQRQLAQIHLEFKSKCSPRLHNPAAAAAASA